MRKEGDGFALHFEVKIFLTWSTNILTIPSQETVPLLNSIQLPYTLFGDSMTSYRKFNRCARASMISMQNPSYLPSFFITYGST